MKLLLDTHLLIWLSRLTGPTLREKRLLELVEAPEVELWFSAASIWEVAIKHALRRGNFSLPPEVLKAALLAADYRELPVTADHGAGVAALPLLHGDPFDRLLIAQAVAENLTLLTANAGIARYPGPIRLV